MKYLLPLALCAAAAAHAGIPTVGGPFYPPLPDSAAMAMLVQAQQLQRTAESVPRNEAVRVLPGGKRLVEEPPGPKSLRKLPTGPSFFIGGTAPSYVIDSNGGLKECGWPWLSQGCRDYRPGAEHRPRGWVVKSGGQWLKCPRRESRSGCVDYYAPPPEMPVQE